MGRTPTPLVIGVDFDWLEQPLIKELRDKGHVIFGLTDPVVAPYDLILSHVAHTWRTEMFSKKTFLEAALKAARARKKV